MKFKEIETKIKCPHCKEEIELTIIEAINILLKEK